MRGGDASRYAGPRQRRARQALVAALLSTLLAYAGCPGPAGPNAGLSSRDPAVRASSARALATAAAPTRTQIAMLGGLLADPVQDVRYAAADALGTHGAAAAAAAPDLGLALSSADVGVRRRAVRALGRMGPAARAESPRVAAALADPDPHVRAWSAVALGRMGATGATRLLVAQLADADGVAVAGAAEGLHGLLGGSDRQAVADSIARTLGVAERPARSWGARLLAISGDARGLGELIALLDEGDASWQRRAAWAIGYLGPRAAEAAPSLEGCLTAADPWVRAYAADSLGRVAPLSPGARARLTSMATDRAEPGEPRAAAALALALQDAALDARVRASAEALARGGSGCSRVWALEALVASRTPGIEAQLAQVAECDPESGVRNAAAELAKTGVTERIGGESTGTAYPLW